jgi:hypothetical protein
MAQFTFRSAALCVAALLMGHTTGWATGSDVFCCTAAGKGALCRKSGSEGPKERPAGGGAPHEGICPDTSVKTGKPAVRLEHLLQGDALCAQSGVDPGVTSCDSTGTGGTNLRSNADASPKVAEDVPFATDDSTEREDEPEPAQELTQRGNGMDKTFFCCAQKSGVEYGFLKTAPKVENAELGAIEKLRKAGIDAKYLMTTHRTSEGGDWAMPTTLVGKSQSPVEAKSGYWVKRSDFVVDFKPKMQKFACHSKIRKAARKVADKAMMIADLNYIKSKMVEICSVVGEVTVMIEPSGAVILSDVAPNQNGDTCSSEVTQISGGLDKCITDL